MAFQITLKSPNSTPPTPVRLANLCTNLGLFRSPNQTPHIRIPQGEHRTLAIPIASPEFSQWLTLTAQEKLALVPTTGQTRDLVHTLTATTNFSDKPTLPTPKRFHRDGNTLSIDLGDQSTIIAINNKGWTMKEDHTTAWLTPRTQLTLPKPQPAPIPATLAVMLATALALKGPQSEQLVEWVTSACNPTPLPHPPLVLIGTARHQAALLLRDLIDPSTTPFQLTPSKDHHLQVFLEVTRLSNAQRSLSQPAIYTNATAIQQAELPLTINVMECNRPGISHLLAALCTALSEQQVAEQIADPTQPEKEIPALIEDPQYLQMEVRAGSCTSTENLESAVELFDHPGIAKLSEPDTPEHTGTWANFPSKYTPHEIRELPQASHSG